VTKKPVPEELSRGGFEGEASSAGFVTPDSGGGGDGTTDEFAGELSQEYLHQFDLEIDSALGIVNRNTGYAFTLNYDAYDFYHAWYPQVTGPAGQRTLSWINGGASFIFAGVNGTYWEQTGQKTPITVIKGQLLNTFMEWIKGVNETYRYYNMFDVWNTFPEGDHFIDGWTCFDFIWRCTDILQREGADINPEPVRSKDWVNLYAKEPPTLLDDNEDTRLDMLHYWEVVTFNFWGSDMSWSEFFSITWDVLWNHRFYLRVGQQDYEAHLSFPYMWTSYAKLNFASEEWVKRRATE